MMTCTGGKFRRHVWAAGRLSLNDTKSVKFSTETHLFYFADYSNSNCENCKDSYHSNAYMMLQGKGRSKF